MEILLGKLRFINFRVSINRKEIFMLEYNIWFSKLKLENKCKLNLLQNFRLDELFYFSNKDLKNINLKENIKKELCNINYKKNLKKDVLYMNKNNIVLVNCNEKAYPLVLRNILDKPALIYIIGNKELLEENNIAIIGTRKPSSYGKKVAISIAKELSDKEITVVSGLAIRDRQLCSYRSIKGKS